MSPEFDRQKHQSVLPLGEQMDRYARIDMLENVEGFIPTSRREITEATGLQSVIGRPGGAAKHFAEVVKHQNKANTRDPLAAARRITREYIGWAQDARVSVQALESLATELADDVNPTLILDRVLEVDDPRMLPFLRFSDLSMLKQDGKPDGIGYDPLAVNYSTDNNGIMFYLGESISKWRVQQVRRQLPTASGHEAARFDFWTARLTEVKNHYPILRPIVEEGFDKIFERKSER